MVDVFHGDVDDGVAALHFHCVGVLLGDVHGGGVALGDDVGAHFDSVGVFRHDARGGADAALGDDVGNLFHSVDVLHDANGDAAGHEREGLHDDHDHVGVTLAVAPATSDSCSPGAPL